MVNTYVTNVGAPNFIKQTALDLKAQVDPPKTIKLGDFNFFLFICAYNV
jgi:hypothetical protein